MDETKGDHEKEIKKLVELNDELENYFRNTIIPQVFVDADLTLRKFSPPAHKHFKFSPSDIGKPIQEIASIMSLPGVADNIKEVIKSNKDLEKEIQTDDGRWFQMNILPYIIKKQNITNGVVITLIDITDRINDKNDIERLNADHETFIYSVSHDFRGPVNNIISLIESLNSVSEQNNKEDYNSLIKYLAKSAKELKTMIDEITDITKIGTRASDGPNLISIESIIEDVKFTLKDKIHQTGAIITTDIKVPELTFSRKNLRSIIYNLLSNAIKFGQPGRKSEIHIATEISEAYIKLSIKDNGIGIEEDKTKEIFSKFTRLRTNVEGTGVGLFIVNKMICNAGGKIEVESKVNTGTTFNIFLPKVNS